MLMPPLVRAIFPIQSGAVRRFWKRPKEWKSPVFPLPSPNFHPGQIPETLNEFFKVTMPQPILSKLGVKHATNTRLICGLLLLVWSLTSGLGAGLPVPEPNTFVLTNPPPGEVSQTPVFSPNPTAAEITRTKIFEEPLIPIWGEPTAEENAVLANAVTAFSNRRERDDFSAFERFLNSPVAYSWYPAVLCALGSEYYHTGHYSKALDAWEEVWLWTQFEQGGRGKTLADRAVGELARMHARIGGFERLESIFEEMGERLMSGSSTERIAGAKQAYWLMMNKPEIAFRCGPLALYAVRRSIDPSPNSLRLFLDSASTQKGFSLKQLADLANEANFDSRMAKRAEGAEFAVPSVIHWNVGHYAALLKRQGDLFWVVDPTFGEEGMWISRTALESESSDYFLVVGKQVPEGWDSVTDKEGEEIFGRGVTSSSNPNNTTPRDLKRNPDCRTGSGGMAIYNFHLLLASLNIEDTPLSFQAPRGMPIDFIVTYNQREANQPMSFNYSNFGQKWTCNWISYLTDSGPWVVGDVQYYVPGGGTETYTDYDSETSAFAIQPRNQSLLVRSSTNSYEMRFPDGSRRIFAQPDGSVGSTRKVFLTEVIDSTDYTNIIHYDSQLRLSMVTDPPANKTNLLFEYDGSQTAFNRTTIRKVTDRYGRYITFNYDVSGSKLLGIVDVLGLESEFAYTGTFIHTLKTPYGETKFAYGEDGRTRWLEATDPLGQKSRAEYTEDPDTVPYSDPGPLVPQGIYRRNTVLNARNTFYWDKKAMRESAGDYSKARIYHWQHGANWASANGILESYKEPLESRVWFNYPGQIPVDEGATLAGTLAEPSRIARVLDDGQTQLWLLLRDSFGNVTNTVDPVGREFTYVYSTNGVDLLEIRQTRGTDNELVFSFSYNSQHLPITATDAAGETTRYAYNSFGQLTYVTNALAQITSFSYDASGRLETINGPLSGSSDSIGYTYDALDRVRTFTDSDGYTITMDYDAMGRTLTNSFPDGTTEEFGYNNLELATFKDRAGRVTTTTYDSLRQLKEIQEGSGAQVVSIDYCNCENISQMVDGAGRPTLWFYDVQGRVTQKVVPGGATVTFNYENNTSRLKSFTNERNQMRTYTWNGDDTLALISYSDTTITPNAAFAYDSDYPRLVAHGTVNGVTELTYNAITSTPTFGAGLLAAIDGPFNDDTISFTYDALGRVTSEMMINSAVSLHSVSNKFGYDVLGRISAVTNKLGVFAYSYVGASARFDNISAPSGQTTTFSYYSDTGDFQLKGITNRVSSTQISRFSYVHNPAGLITNWTQQVGTGTPKEYNLLYDLLYQLTNVTVVVAGTTNTTYAYRFDTAGNRLLEKNGGSTWNAYYNAKNELVGKDAGLTVNNQSFEWDEENRLAAIVQGTNRTTFLYDALSRYSEIHTYNGTNLVQSRYFTWNGAQIIQELYWDSTAGYTTAKWFVDQGFTAYDAAWAPAPERYFVYNKDHLGSVRESLRNGSLDARYDYDPFGRRSVLQSSASSRNPDHGFTGLYTLGALNLALYREYDPDLGRWISRDPIGEEGGLNLYQYAANDPINLVDIYGLCPSGGNPRNSLGGVTPSNSGRGIRPPGPPNRVTSSGGAQGGGGGSGRNPTNIGGSNRRGFSNANFGNAVHQRFRDALTQQTGTRPSDWLVRTRPGQTGIDATYIGPASRNPGFNYAELKPTSPGSISTFGSQLGRWNLPPGQTELWLYNPSGIIGSSGFIF